MVLIDFILVALEAVFHFAHVVLVWVDEFDLLAFEHIIDFVFQTIGEGVEIFDEIFYFFGMGLGGWVGTLYL